MKTLFSMYAMLYVGMMALTHSSTFHTLSFFTQIHSKTSTKFKKFRINSKKLE